MSETTLQDRLKAGRKALWHLGFLNGVAEEWREDIKRAFLALEDRIDELKASNEELRTAWSVEHDARIAAETQADIARIKADNLKESLEEERNSTKENKP